jgi:transcription-repair coupling factor (superfamily II helicase)
MPVKTIIEPFHEATVAAALRREHRRRGQSFVVCPRIEDIAPMAQRIRELVPELKTITLHGRMPAADIDGAMMNFAAGDADILLATNIIESGLDLPRANTIIVWRPDKFGLAQLHQLRGRVGRRNTISFALFLTDPGSAVSGAATKRLETLRKLDGHGAGFLISAGDMDLRGGGDLLSEKQSGHIQLLGADLSRQLLEQALGHANLALFIDKRPEVRLDIPTLLPLRMSRTLAFDSSSTPAFSDVATTANWKNLKTRSRSASANCLPKRAILSGWHDSNWHARGPVYSASRWAQNPSQPHSIAGGCASCRRVSMPMINSNGTTGG